MNRKELLQALAVLTKIDHMMDTGLLPFVMFNDQRIPVEACTMQELNLLQGQLISTETFKTIMKLCLRDCEASMALNKAMDA